jgi:hypothetical protein
LMFEFLRRSGFIPVRRRQAWTCRDRRPAVRRRASDPDRRSGISVPGVFTAVRPPSPSARDQVCSSARRPVSPPPLLSAFVVLANRTSWAAACSQLRACAWSPLFVERELVAIPALRVFGEKRFTMLQPVLGRRCISVTSLMRCPSAHELGQASSCRSPRQFSRTPDRSSISPERFSNDWNAAPVLQPDLFGLPQVCLSHRARSCCLRLGCCQLVSWLQPASNPPAVRSATNPPPLTCMLSLPALPPTAGLSDGDLPQARQRLCSIPIAYRTSALFAQRVQRCDPELRRGGFQRLHRSQSPRSIRFGDRPAVSSI